MMIKLMKPFPLFVFLLSIFVVISIPTAWGQLSPEQYEGKYAIYNFDFTIESPDGIFSVNGPVKYQVISYDNVNKKYQVEISFEFQSQEGEITTNSEIKEVYSETPFELENAKFFIDPILPGIFKNKSHSSNPSSVTIDNIEYSSMNHISIIDKHHVLADMIDENGQEIELTMVSRIKETKEIIKETIPYSINFELISTGLLKNIEANQIPEEFLIDWKPVLDEYSKMKLQLTMNLEDTNIDLSSIRIEQISKQKVPEWIKNNAKWWADDQIGDSDFVGGIQHLIKEKIIDIPDLPEQASGTAKEQVPDWVRNNAGWWADGLISEDDFVNGIKYLVEKGIIKV